MLGHYFILIVFPQWWYQLFPHGAEDSQLLKHYLQLLFIFLLKCDDDTRLWSQIFSCLLLSPFNSVTTRQDDGSKFSWLSKYPTCLGRNSRGCREIWSCSKWTEFGMVSAAGETAGFEERLGSWKYCKLGTGTFACIWYKVFSICVILDIILSRVSCKVGVADEGSWAICVISVCCWFTAILETGTVHNKSSCILDRNILRNRSQGGFNKVVLICTWHWHWCHRWKLQTYTVGTCLFYRTRIKANMEKILITVVTLTVWSRFVINFLKYLTWLFFAREKTWLFASPIIWEWTIREFKNGDRSHYKYFSEWPEPDMSKINSHVKCSSFRLQWVILIWKTLRRKNQS